VSLGSLSSAFVNSWADVSESTGLVLLYIGTWSHGEQSSDSVGMSLVYGSVGTDREAGFMQSYLQDRLVGSNLKPEPTMFGIMPCQSLSLIPGSAEVVLTPESDTVNLGTGFSGAWSHRGQPSIG
jgi:hypothetical protein